MASSSQDHQEDLEELVKCPICLDSFTDPRFLPCHHTLCLGCLEGVLGVNRQMKCPVCKRQVQVTNGVSDFPADFRANSVLEVISEYQRTKASQGTGPASREQTGQEEIRNIASTPRSIHRPTDLEAAAVDVHHDNAHCPVCEGVPTDPHCLNCGHFLCWNCVEFLLPVGGSHVNCPTCDCETVIVEASTSTRRRNSTGDDGNPSDTCSGYSTGYNKPAGNSRHPGYPDDLFLGFNAMNLGYQSGGPRCDECHNTFGTGVRILEVNGRTLHERCFCCSECRMPIGSNGQCSIKGGDVFCRTCYGNKFCPHCKSCKGVIRDCVISFNNNPYHQDCFRCNNCRASLHRGNIQQKNNVPYCKNCYGQLFAEKCYRCTRPIMSKCYTCDGRTMHEECFRCCRCNASLAHQGGFKEGDQYICEGCARSQQLQFNVRVFR